MSSIAANIPMPSEIVLSVLAHVWKTLQTLNVPMAMMGGLAVSNWRHVRFTQDVDILIGIDRSQADRVIAILAAAGIRAKRPDPLVILEDAEFIQLYYEPPDTYLEIQVDLLLAKSEFLQQALQRRVATTGSEFGVDVDVVSVEDLIILKLLAGRILDRVDAAYLLRFNRERINMAHLLKWIAQFKLGQVFAEIWPEAFPGESPPPQIQNPKSEI
jgi:hypothetical protein